jgi:hypothetical protein
MTIMPLPSGAQPLVLLAWLPAYQSIKSASGGPENISLLDSAPPVGSALSRSKHRKEAGQWHCQITTKPSSLATSVLL